MHTRKIDRCLRAHDRFRILPKRLASTGGAYNSDDVKVVSTDAEYDAYLHRKATEKTRLDSLHRLYVG